MHVLIIGGTGLISTAITRELVARGEQVTLYNRGQTTPSTEIPENAAGMIAGDRTDAPRFAADMAAAGPFDCAIDMVCYAPEEAEGAVAALRGRVGHYVFCSTVDVYTKPAPAYPIREDAPRVPRPSFPYAYKKRQCEAIVEAAHATGNFPTTIIRPAYTYGEGRGMLSTFGGGPDYLGRLRAGRPIIVHGDGMSLWGACHRDDVAHAFAHAAGNRQTFGRAYHVTGEEWLPWDVYHAQVAAAMDAPLPTLVHIPADLLAQAVPEHGTITHENFQYDNIFDNAAARADLDFRYTVSVADGVRRIVAWLDARDRIPAPSADADDWEDRLIALWERHAAAFVTEAGAVRAESTGD